MDDTRRVDRSAIGDVIQRVPSDRYTFSMWSAIDDGRAPRRCVIGDARGLDVLATIEGGRMCLYLHDIGGVLRDRLGGLGFVFPEHDADGSRLRHGMVIASRDHGLAVPASLGPGAIEVLGGRFRALEDADSHIVASGERFGWSTPGVRHFVAVDGPAVALVHLAQADAPAPGLVERAMRAIDTALWKARRGDDPRPVDHRLVRRPLARPRG